MCVVYLPAAVRKALVSENARGNEGYSVDSRTSSIRLQHPWLRDSAGKRGLECGWAFTKDCIQLSQCQKVVYKSGAYTVKIRHQNCLLQVNHVKVQCLNIIF